MGLKAICRKYSLEATQAFWDSDEVELAYIYNGAGADWMPSWSRKILTAVLILFQGAFIIHDFDYHVSDGSKKNFDVANSRMKSNMKKILNTEFPFAKFWLWWGRSRWWSKAKLTYEFCDRLGWSAWELE